MLHLPARLYRNPPSLFNLRAMSSNVSQWPFEIFSGFCKQDLSNNMEERLAFSKEWRNHGAQATVPERGYWPRDVPCCDFQVSPYLKTPLRRIRKTVANVARHGLHHRAFGDRQVRHLQPRARCSSDIERIPGTTPRPTYSSNPGPA